MRIIAYILARGGSVRLPRKNILPLNGKPLIAHTIEAALACTRFTRIIVSTDSREIAETALYYGAEVPFLRDAELAKPDTSSFLALCDAIYRVKEAAAPLTVLLQPTSPFRTAQDIIACIDAADPAAVTTSQGKLTGGVYAIKTQVLLKTQSFTPKGVRFVEVSARSALDIDTLKDFQQAQNYAQTQSLAA
jgi:CMP-N-acetylneuraminic acid synthetase